MTNLTNITIHRAQSTDLDPVSPLFHAYRSFYQRPDEGGQAEEFIAARLAKQDSVLFLALGAEGQALGFTQLFPTFLPSPPKLAGS